MFGIAWYNAIHLSFVHSYIVLDYITGTHICLFVCIKVTILRHVAAGLSAWGPPVHRPCYFSSFCFLSSSVSIQITLGCLIRARQWERKREASLPYHRSYPRSSPPSFCLSFPLISFHQLYHKQILLIESLRGLLFYMAFHTHCSGNESSRLYMFTGNMHTKRIYCTGQLCHFLIQGQI